MKLGIVQVHSSARAASCRESSLDLSLFHWRRPRLPLPGTKSVTDGNILFEAFYPFAKGASSLRFGEVHERPDNHRTGNNGLPNLEH